MMLNERLLEGNPVFELWNFGLFCLFRNFKIRKIRFKFRVVYFVEKKF